MTNQERKALEIFVILVASFYTMLESESGREEFIKILSRMTEKAKGDKFAVP